MLGEGQEGWSFSENATWYDLYQYHAFEQTMFLFIWLRKQKLLTKVSGIKTRDGII